MAYALDRKQIFLVAMRNPAEIVPSKTTSVHCGTKSMALNPARDPSLPQCSCHSYRVRCMVGPLACERRQLKENKYPAAAIATVLDKSAGDGRDAEEMSTRIQAIPRFDTW
jgi:hypothetical protein